MEQLGDMVKDADMVVAVYDVTKTESFGNVAKVIDVFSFSDMFELEVERACVFLARAELELLKLSLGEPQA